MIKKIIITAAFVGSMLVSVPNANAASYSECVMKYQLSVAGCGGYGPCEAAADAALLRCIEGLVDTIE
ncbi:hypothetical protein [Brevundimonas sp. SL130]|uniref:hypothetical protein n=1 Tax=Brevundimonas sp. SL130 TaxID=2995143 RepID=UPI00226C7A8D|nr:hypothetical protein [Brevundimonas sp. SL130]WAC60372.1 hypothetical protein OU998_02700 [Brevundimonas sp. SL130]